MIWYRVQVGAYAFPKSAERVKVDLIEKGFKPAIVREDLLYKVRVGSFQDKKKAEKQLARVKKYKEYSKAKIFEWNDGKDLPIIDISGSGPGVAYDYHPRIDLVCIWHTETHEDMYGDAQVFIEYDKWGTDIVHTVLVDTGMYGSDTIKKLKKLGIKTLDAIVISHAHGDHYGYLDEIMKQFKVGHLYLPCTDGLKKYQPAYAKALQNKEKKAKAMDIPVTYLKGGDHFEVGRIECDCVFQVPADRLKEHDDHHFVNNQSIITMFTLDGVGKALLTGDLSNPGNDIVMDYYKNWKVALQADVAKCPWHADKDGLSVAWIAFIGAISWYWNYHSAKNRGDRNKTTQKLIDGGVKAERITRNFEDGDVKYSFYDGVWTVSSSKHGVLFAFNSRFGRVN